MNDSERIAILETESVRNKEDIERHGGQISTFWTFMNKAELSLDNIENKQLPSIEKKVDDKMRFNNWLTAMILVVLVGKWIAGLFGH